ncbi:MAG: hypothetical protein VZR25_05865 [Acutalibacteraceae bacterium]|nr:hypothetical protein [Acutalibacteraceae bacterium]MEE3374657.1 hypothetical protein [Acutalibacteraceae bacterium]
MDYFPDLMDPMEERDAFDLANEAWMYDEMTKDDDFDSDPLDELDGLSDDLDDLFKDDDLYKDDPDDDLNDDLFKDDLDDDFFADDFGSEDDF